MPLAFTTYEWLKAIHVLAAVIWVGGAVMLQAFAWRATRSGDAKRLAAFARDAEFVGMKIFMPASIVLIIFGAWAVHELSWNWSAPWISFGLVVWLLSFIVGAGFLGPESGRIAKAVEAQGDDSPEVVRRRKRILLIGRIETALLLLVVLDMVLKPT